MFFTPSYTIGEAGKIFHVTGNFESIDKAIRAGNYGDRFGWAEERLVYHPESPNAIPTSLHPVDEKVGVVKLLDYPSTSEISRRYPRVCDLITLLAFAAKFPKEQLAAPHFVIWQDATGQFWRGSVGCDYCRDVSVRHSHPNEGWYAGYRLLVRLPYEAAVPKFVYRGG